MNIIEKAKTFDSYHFKRYIAQSFDGADSPFVRDIIENITHEAITRHGHTLDEVVYFILDFVPEVDFGEVAMFADDSILTEYGRTEKQYALAKHAAEYNSAMQY